jgi:hypothetical protein
MIFVTGDFVGLPSKAESYDMIIPRIVIEKLSKHELELADFNWSGAYSYDNSLSYLNEPYKFKMVVEVRVKLDIAILQSRQAIYERCFQAVKLNEVLLKRFECFDSKLTKTKYVLSFDMNSAA